MSQTAPPPLCENHQHINRTELCKKVAGNRKAESEGLATEEACAIREVIYHDPLQERVQNLLQSSN